MGQWQWNLHVDGPPTGLESPTVDCLSAPEGIAGTGPESGSHSFLDLPERPFEQEGVADDVPGSFGTCDVRKTADDDSITGVDRRVGSGRDGTHSLPRVKMERAKFNLNRNRQNYLKDLKTLYYVCVFWFFCITSTSFEKEEERKRDGERRVDIYLLSRKKVRGQGERKYISVRG